MNIFPKSERSKPHILFAWLFIFSINLDFSLHVSQRCRAGTAKNFWFRVQNRAKTNFLPLCLQTYLAWIFLFLNSFLNNYPWTFEKIVFQQAMSIKRVAKTKNEGSQGEKLAKRGIETTAFMQKKYKKNIETLLAKQTFSLLIWHRQLKFMLQHPTVWFDRKQSK